MSDPVITQNFGTTWRRIEPRLRADLRERGVSDDSARDVCQEVALRALSRDLPFESATHLLRWARLVGRRLAIDDHRRTRRVQLGDVPDVGGGHQTEDIVSGRFDVASVAAALNQLSASDRELLVAQPTSIEDRREQVRTAVRRHRARQRVLAIVGNVAAWVAAVPGVRRLARRQALAVILLAPIVATVGLLPYVTDAGHGHSVDDRVTPTTSTSTHRADGATTSGSGSAADRASQPRPTSTLPDPLTQLHGTTIDHPDAIGSGETRVRERRPDDRLFCFRDGPLGDVCTPL